MSYRNNRKYKLVLALLSLAGIFFVLGACKQKGIAQGFNGEKTGVIGVVAREDTEMYFWSTDPDIRVDTKLFEDGYELKTSTGDSISVSFFDTDMAVNTEEDQFICEANGVRWYDTPADGGQWYVANAEGGRQILLSASDGVSKEVIRKAIEGIHWEWK